MAIHSFLCFPETAGKPLEEVEEIFALKTPAWKTKGGFAQGLEMEKGEHATEKYLQFALHKKEDVPV
jgi:hypothetical protein